MRLVLIMGGGVSLGTYIAGALTEIHWALRSLHGLTHWSPPHDPPDIRIEVLAGSSAGAVSAAAFARVLTGHPEAIADLHRAWVRELSFAALLARNGAPDPTALLSVAKIDDLAWSLIRAPRDYRDWQPFCAEPLRIGVTLSNLGGVRYRIQYANAHDTFFSTTIHRDQLHLRLDNPTPPEVWETLRDAALASAAFPAVFPPRQLTRPRSDYEPATFAGDWETVLMTYVDGGVFDNEPIGLAKRLVELNPAHQRLDYRYILIDPYLDRNRDGLNPPVHTPPTSLPGVLGALARAVLGQSNAKDWLRANKLNWRLAEHETFITNGLRPLVDAARAGSPAVAAQLGDEIRRHALQIARFKRGVNLPVPPDDDEVAAYYHANLDRIARDPRYAEALAGLDGGAYDAMLATIFIVEAAAGLRAKEPLDLYLIAPPGHDPNPLAGDFLHNFGGFFREEWRQHDFLCGRRDARRVLTTELLDRETGEPVFVYPPEDGVNYDPPPIEPSVDDIPPRDRAELHRLLKERLQPLIEPHLPWWSRPLSGSITSGLAKKLLQALGLPKSSA